MKRQRCAAAPRGRYPGTDRSIPRAAPQPAHAKLLHSAGLVSSALALVIEEAAGLALPQPRIEPALREQLVMACLPRRCAALSSTISRSIAAMVDSRCAMAITVLPCISRVEALLDRRLDLGVERRGRLVEHQDRRVLEQHARDRDALALAAGQLDAALADMRVVAACGPCGSARPAMNSCASARCAAAIICVVARVGPAVERCCRAPSGAAARCPA